MKPVFVGTGVVVVVALGAALVWLVLNKEPGFRHDATKNLSASSSPQTSLAPAPDLPATLGPHREAPAGLVEYYNEQYRFSLFYPKGLSVREYDEGGGAATIVFQNTEQGQGFQIFAVPYGASQVSPERFRRDEPSGVMRAPRDITIDGAVAKSFFGNNTALGDTAEVWFIRGGFLFEVTAPESLAGWLSQIMNSWKFL